MFAYKSAYRCELRLCLRAEKRAQFIIMISLMPLNNGSLSLQQKTSDIIIFVRHCALHFHDISFFCMASCLANRTFMMAICVMIVPIFLLSVKSVSNLANFYLILNMYFKIDKKMCSINFKLKMAPNIVSKLYQHYYSFNFTNV